MSEPATQRIIRPVTPTSRSAPNEVPKLTKGGDDNKPGTSTRNTAAAPGNMTPPVADFSPPPARVPDAVSENHVHDSWQPIDTARKDGRPIWLCDKKGNIVESVWRKSRQFRMEKNSYGKWVSKWEDTGYWSVLNYGGTKVPFTPVFWHEHQYL